MSHLANLEKVMSPIAKYRGVNIYEDYTVRGVSYGTFSAAKEAIDNAYNCLQKSINKKP